MSTSVDVLVPSRGRSVALLAFGLALGITGCTGAPVAVTPSPEGLATVTAEPLATPAVEPTRVRPSATDTPAPTPTIQPTVTPTQVAPTPTLVIPSSPPTVPGFDGTASPEIREPSPTISVAPTPTRTPSPTLPPTATSTPRPTSTPVPIVRPPAGSSRTGFVSLDDPAFLPASAATYLADDELVLGLEHAGEARAYPVQMMWYHHIVNDAVRGKPFLLTY